MLDGPGLLTRLVHFPVCSLSGRTGCACPPWIISSGYTDFGCYNYVSHLPHLFGSNSQQGLCLISVLCC